MNIARNGAMRCFIPRGKCRRLMETGAPPSPPSCGFEKLPDSLRCRDVPLLEVLPDAAAAIWGVPEPCLACEMGKHVSGMLLLPSPRFPLLTHGRTYQAPTPFHGCMAGT